MWGEYAGRSWSMNELIQLNNNRMPLGHYDASRLHLGLSRNPDALLQIPQDTVVSLGAPTFSAMYTNITGPL